MTSQKPKIVDLLYLPEADDIEIDFEKADVFPISETRSLVFCNAFHDEYSVFGTPVPMLRRFLILRAVVPGAGIFKRGEPMDEASFECRPFQYIQCAIARQGCDGMACPGEKSLPSI